MPSRIEEARSRLTVTQRKMLDVLSDGMAHTREELRACLPDDLAANASISNHLRAIREVLRELGQTILTQYQKRRVIYRHVRLSSYEEPRTARGRKRAEESNGSH